MIAWTASKRRPSKWNSSSQYRALSMKKSRTGRCVAAVEVDRGAPGVWWRSVKNEWAKALQVVTVRAEMVVDDVEEHHQALGACAASTRRFRSSGVP